MSAEKVKYAILGGMAVSLYGEPRYTGDVDVNILLEKTRILDFVSHAKRFGLSPLFGNIGKLAWETGVIPMRLRKGKVEGKIDLTIAENILEYNAIKRSCLKKLDGIKVRVVSPEDLILHKMASSRPRDREDLRGILIRQNCHKIIYEI